jgi:tetratricopeptide (TPR) repeat protein
MLSSSYVGLFPDGLKVKEPKIIILRNLNKLEELVNKLKNNLKDAYDQLKTTKDGRKVVYIDVSKVAGKPILQLPEAMTLNIGPEILLGKLESFTRSWLEQHPVIDATVLTEPKRYVDSMGIPYAITLEQKTISSSVAPGWTTVVSIVPIPKDIPPEDLVNVGVELAKRGHHNMALSCYRKAIKINPSLKEAYNNLGKLMTEIGRPDEALAYLDKALELDPNYASALVNRGIALATLGRYEEALELFEKSVCLEPDNEKAWYNKAMIHYVLGVYDRAQECIGKALDINPGYMPAQKLKCELERVQKWLFKSQHQDWKPNDSAY